MSYEDNIDEELLIMEEQDSEGTVLSAATFKQLISELPVIKPKCVPESSTLGEVVKIMQDNHFGSVLVTNDTGQVSGIITERDILMKVIGKMPDYELRPVTDAMTHGPICLYEEDMICFVLNNMHVGGYRHVPVIDKSGKPISIISIKDVVSFILDYFPNEITNILSEPFRGTPQRESA